MKRVFVLRFIRTHTANPAGLRVVLMPQWKRTARLKPPLNCLIKNAATSAHVSRGISRDNGCFQVGGLNN